MSKDTTEPTASIDWHTGVPLAQGGSGEVVRAFSPELGREIAIKYLRQEDPAAIERMLREARTQRALSHPHILPIHATGVHLDRHYIAMDLVDGQPLDHYLKDSSTEDKLAVFDQVLDAMAYAHSKGVVHRDLKPANVMVETRDGRAHAWVMDFGLARRPEDATLTLAGDALGTPGYMSPEQARGDEGAAAQSDIYALGVVLYQLLTGRLPYSADTPMALVMQAAAGQTLALNEIRRLLPDGLARIVVCCLESDPDRRYCDAGALRDDLATFTAGQSVEAPVLGRRYRLSRWARRHPWRARLAVALAAVLVVGGGTLAVIAEQNRRALSAASTLIAEAERARGDWYIDQLLPRHDQRIAEQRARSTVDRLTGARDGLSNVAAARIDAALADLLDAIGEPGRAFDHARSAWQGGVTTAGVASRAARARLQQFGSRRLQLGLTADAASLDGLVAAERQQLGADLLPFRAALDAGMLDRLDQALGLEPDPDEPLALLPVEELTLPEHWQTLLLDLQRAAVSAIDRLNIDAETAVTDLADLEEQLEGLQGIARSYRPAYQLACTIEAARQSLRTMQSDAVAGEYSRTGCDRGLKLSADDAELLAASSMQLWQRAKDLRRDRQAFDEPLTRAISQARRALSVEPDNELAQISLGSALQIRGRQQLAAGDNPTPALDESLRWLEQVHAIRPNDVNVMNNLAVTWSTISSARLGAGDSKAALTADRHSLRWLENAAEVAPDDRRLTHNVLLARVSLIYQEFLYGQDPTLITQRTVAALESLSAAHSDYISPLNTIGLAWWTQGLWDALTGGRPDTAMRAARAAFERALQRRPDWESAKINLAGVARQWYALSESRPSAELTAFADAALASYQDMEGENADESEFGCNMAEILVARARWAPTEQATALLREAHELSRLERNIEWSHDGCRIARARLGQAWASGQAELDKVETLWEETLSVTEGSEDPLLLIASTRFAQARGHDSSAAQLLARIPAPFQHRIRPPTQIALTPD